LIFCYLVSIVIVHNRDTQSYVGRIEFTYYDFIEEHRVIKLSK